VIWSQKLTKNLVNHTQGMTSTRNIRRFERQHNLGHTCIIALTGLASSSARLEALESGVDHYLTKPVQFKRLIGLFGLYPDRSGSGSNSSNSTTRGSLVSGGTDGSIPESLLET
jgi:DNA-binding response OmpR family regulator